MDRRVRLGIAAAVLAGGSVAVGAGVVAASSDDDGTETPITGEALEKASTAALDHVGGGSVTETEVGDEEGYYEVEVTREDGSQVDVHLTEDFEVIDARDDGDEDDDGDLD